MVSVGSWKHDGYSIGNNSTPNTQEEEVLTPSKMSCETKQQNAKERDLCDNLNLSTINMKSSNT